MKRIDYVTPTQLAEEAYEASKRRKQPIGLAGLPIPSPRAVYSHTLDGKLLNNIAEAAYAAFKARELAPEREAEAAALLRADLVARYPQADMATLDRYGHAEKWDGVAVALIASPIEANYWVSLPEPVLIPRRTERTIGHHSFYMDLGGTTGSTAPPVPPASEPFFRAVHLTRLAWDVQFKPAYHWCSMFRQPHGRWPRWHEIESQFPRIGEWLDQQRALMNRKDLAA